MRDNCDSVVCPASRRDGGLRERRDDVDETREIVARGGQTDRGANGASGSGAAETALQLRNRETVAKAIEAHGHPPRVEAERRFRRAGIAEAATAHVHAGAVRPLLHDLVRDDDAEAIEPGERDGAA